MPTTWNALYLGVNPIIDPTEGNTSAENAGALVGTTFGGPNDKLFDESVSVQTINNGGSPGQLEQDNSVVGDSLRFDLGAGTVTTTFDAVVEYNGTITYTDGTTWTGKVNIVQDSLGNTFLVPHTANSAPQQALIAKPIESVQLTSVSASNNSGLQSNRQTTNFLACFTKGTRILTPGGERRIETLQPGDLVMTHDHGAQPLRWIGRTATRGQGDHAPIQFAPGAIGNERALRVSPQHRMFLADWRAELLFGEAEVLVPAKFLVGCPGVTLAPCESLTYVHLMFQRHEMVLAEGSWSESFYPGDLALSGDAAARAEILALFPDLVASHSGYGPTARRVLFRPETRTLLARGTDLALAA